MAITYFGHNSEDTINPGWLVADRLYWNNPAVVEYTCPGSGNQLVRALECYLYNDTGRPDMHVKVMVFTAAGALVCTAVGLVVSDGIRAWKGVANDPTAISPANTTLTGGAKYVLAFVGDNPNLMPQGTALADAANYQTDSYASPSTTLPAAAGTHHLELDIRCGVEPAPDPAPTITSLDVTSGTAAGGTAVDITGTGFTATPGVTFGGTAATSVVRVSATHVTCVTPAHAVGAVDVVLTNPDTQTATKSNGYTYVPAETPFPAADTYRRLHQSIG